MTFVLPMKTLTIIKCENLPNEEANLRSQTLPTLCVWENATRINDGNTEMSSKSETCTPKHPVRLVRSERKGIFTFTSTS